MLETHSEHTFGALLRGHRLAAGLTQATLAEKAGISTRGVQDLERGLSRPHRETLLRLVAALNLSPDEDRPTSRRFWETRRATLATLRTGEPRGFGELLTHFRLVVGHTHEQLPC